jgi:hypothetical protein
MSILTSQQPSKVPRFLHFEISHFTSRHCKPKIIIIIIIIRKKEEKEKEKKRKEKKKRKLPETAQLHWGPESRTSLAYLAMFR